MVDEIRKKAALNELESRNRADESSARTRGKTKTKSDTAAKDAVETELAARKSAAGEVERVPLRDPDEADRLAQSVAARLVEAGDSSLEMNNLDPERVEQLVA